MSAYNGFSNFTTNQPASAPSTSENSSGCSSPPCYRLGDSLPLPLTDNPQQPNGLADDEDIGDDDVLDGCLQSNPADAKARSSFHPYARSESKHPGSKLKATTAERRATHNAIERARRESLNGRFLELARALPTMQSVKRPSKSVIVNKSLEWICESQAREYELVRENDFLRNQVNELRAQLQMEPLPHTRLLMPQGQQVSYGLPGVHPSGTPASENNRNFASSATYTLPPQHPVVTQRSNSFGSKRQAAVSGPNPAEGQSSPTSQGAMSHQPAAGPFPVPHPQGAQSYLPPRNVYESGEGSERKLEEAKLPGSQSYRTTNAADEKVSSIYLPGLSIQADSGSPFRSLSEPEGPLSTAVSSPNRLRYFSSSGSSDGSDKSQSGADYPNAVGLFGAVPKPLLPGSMEQLNPGGTTGPVVEMSATGNPVVPAEVPLPIEPFDAHLTHAQSSPSAALPGFVPTTYPDQMHQDLFASVQSLPRHSLMHGSMIPSHAPFSQLGSHDMSPNGFPIGAPWVWG
ncbi:hypothetical protein PCANC_05847 [Puccinia coronata f. sp. avenae]|uniref:BHLH domain-containing protein n=1 Tax=Puccinia coronata f. sp. avenae TaxID=200324 RepID=A0A2N5VBN0_9BASI|nr:hypothetical protein PCANC_05847 [Puccinia coronata f. sp. avenae]